MAALLQTLSGNPLQTPIGQKIEQATEPSLPSEDWASFMEICDMINDTDEGPKDAARAIKRRLQQNAGKNHVAVMYTLTLLETCVKNCGKRFHTLVTSKDFVQDLVKLIGPKNDPPPVLQEKVLNLIQTWSLAFRGQPECSGVVQVYIELMAKKVEFPVTDLDSTAPIHTPQRSVPPYQRKATNESIATSGSPTNTSSNPISTLNRSLPTNIIPGSSSPSSSPITTATVAATGASPVSSFHTMSTGQVSQSPDQLVKLKNELDVVQGNVKVFHEMLNELVPGKEHPDDWSLLCDLNATCQAMQKRIVELIEKVANEEVTNELLRINDDLNNVFERYERYERKRTNTATSVPTAAPTSNANILLSPVPPTLSKSKASEPSLIDLSVDEPIPVDVLSKGVQGISLNKNLKSNNGLEESVSVGDADFDSFAQSRTSIGRTEPKTVEPSGLDSLEEAIRSGNPSGGPPDSLNSDGKSLMLDSVRDLVEMENWLRDQNAAPNASAFSTSASTVPKGGDFNFEKFLTERADARDKMPK